MKERIFKLNLGDLNYTAGKLCDYIFAQLWRAHVGKNLFLS